MKTLLLILIFVLFLMAIFIGAWFCVEAGRKRNAFDDLIYLKFLIYNSQTDHISEKNIRSIFIDYKGKKEYDQQELEKLYKQFTDKFYTKR